MKKAAILDPNAHKNLSSGHFKLYFEKSLEKKTFSSNGNYLTLKALNII